MTDGQLLNLFATRRDHKAFRDLVVRHGPSVLRVCRSVLRDPHASEDAFQATFLVLVRRAPMVQDPELVGNWLRGVAYRVALQLKRRSNRNRESGSQGVEMIPSESPRHELLCELEEALYEELARLPEAYRAPLTLCYLDGLTHEEAAGRLEWPLGTLKVRLVRGRRILKERLDRRGLSLGVIAMLLWLWPRRTAAVPPPLVEATVEAMALDTSRGSAPPTFRFGRVSSLADALVPSGGSPSRFWGLWAVVLLAVLTTGGAALARQWRPVAAEFPLALPDNLMNVLNVDCH